MPSYQQVREALIALATRENDLERYYRISEDLIVAIHVEVVGRSRRARRLLRRNNNPNVVSGGLPVPEIEPRIDLQIVNNNTRYIEWEELTSAELELVVFHKRTLERWIAGDIMELPPSNTDKPVYDPSREE